MVRKGGNPDLWKYKKTGPKTNLGKLRASMNSIKLPDMPGLKGLKGNKKAILDVLAILKVTSEGDEVPVVKEMSNLFKLIKRINVESLYDKLNKGQQFNRNDIEILKLQMESLMNLDKLTRRYDENTIEVNYNSIRNFIFDMGQMSDRTNNQRLKEVFTSQKEGLISEKEELTQIQEEVNKEVLVNENVKSQ